MQTYTLPLDDGTDFEFEWTVTGKEIIEADKREGIDIADIQDDVKRLQDEKRVSSMFSVGSNIIYLGLQSKDEYSLEDIQKMLTIDMVRKEDFAMMIRDMVASLQPPKPPNELEKKDKSKAKEKTS